MATWALDANASSQAPPGPTESEAPGQGPATCDLQALQVIRRHVRVGEPLLEHFLLEFGHLQDVLHFSRVK